MIEELRREVWELVALSGKDFTARVSQYSREQLEELCTAALRMLPEGQQAELAPLITGRAADE